MRTIVYMFLSLSLHTMPVNRVPGLCLNAAVMISRPFRGSQSTGTTSEKLTNVIPVHNRWTRIGVAMLQHAKSKLEQPPVHSVFGTTVEQMYASDTVI